MKNSKLIEIVGWYGLGATLIAYFLVSFMIIDPNNLLYQLLNLTGALGLVAISLLKRAYQPAILDIVWSIIALVALIRILM